MKYLIFILLPLINLFSAFNIFAASQVSYLNIDGDNVHFVISEAKTAISPECVVDETKERFAVSLKTEEGRAMYSLLITAMSKNIDVTVISALDCGDAFGLERAQSVSIAPTVIENDSNNSLFKGTILEHPFKVENDYFWKDSELSAGIFFGNTFGMGRGEYKLINTTNRTLIGSAGGSGWLTAILTSFTRHGATKLEVIVDGTVHIFDFSTYRGGRWFFGLAEASPHYLGEQIAGPLTVVSQGKGIRFERYVQVWIQSDDKAPAPDNETTSGINFAYDK